MGFWTRQLFGGEDLVWTGVDGQVLLACNSSGAMRLVVKQGAVAETELRKRVCITLWKRPAWAKFRSKEVSIKSLQVCGDE